MLTAQIATPDPIPLWFQFALEEVSRSVVERPGEAANPRILEYFKVTTLGQPSDGDETPWCSAGACWCVEKAGIASTRRASARSWLLWGDELAEPRLGCIVVFSRGPTAALSGHVAFYLGRHNQPRSLCVLGGNQGNRWSFKPYPEARVLGYRWPRR